MHAGSGRNNVPVERSAPMADAVLIYGKDT